MTLNKWWATAAGQALEPPDGLKTEGWDPERKVGAQHLNWLFNFIFKRLSFSGINGDSLSGSANITLTYDSPRRIRFTGLSADLVNETLPKTGVQAGKEVFIVNDDGTYTVYLLADDASEVWRVPPKSCALFSALIDAPSTNTDWAVLAPPVVTGKKNVMPVRFKADGTTATPDVADGTRGYVIPLGTQPTSGDSGTGVASGFLYGILKTVAGAASQVVPHVAGQKKGVGDLSDMPLMLGPIFTGALHADVDPADTNAHVPTVDAAIDSNSNWASNKFTPTIAGRYRVVWNQRLQGGSGTGRLELHIKKNGSTAAQLPISNPNSGVELPIHFERVLYLNGTTDYIEFEYKALDAAHVFTLIAADGELSITRVA